MTYEYENAMGYLPSAPTRVVEVYGTMPEAQEYVQEEFNLPYLPPAHALQPPMNPRTDPYRLVTILPIEPAMGNDQTVPSFFERNKGWLVPVGVIAGGYFIAKALGLLGERELLANPPIKDVKLQEAGPTGYIPAKRGEAKPYDPAKLRPPGRYRTVKAYVDACLEINPDALEVKKLPAELGVFKDRSPEAARQEAIEVTEKAYLKILAVGRNTFAPEDWVGKPGLYFRFRNIALISAHFENIQGKIKLIGVATLSTALRLWIYLGMPAVSGLTTKSKDTIRYLMRTRGKQTVRPRERPQLLGYTFEREGGLQAVRSFRPYTRTPITPGTKGSAAWKLLQTLDFAFKEDAPELVTPRLVWQILNIKGAFRLDMDTLEGVLTILKETPAKNQWRIRWYVEYEIKSTWDRTPTSERQVLMDEGIFVDVHPSIINNIMGMPEKEFIRRYSSSLILGETAWARLYGRLPKADALRRAQPAAVASISMKSLSKLMQSKELAQHYQDELDEVAEKHIDLLMEQIEKDQLAINRSALRISEQKHYILKDKSEIEQANEERKLALKKIKDTERQVAKKDKVFYFDELRLNSLYESYEDLFRFMQEKRKKISSREARIKKLKKRIRNKKTHAASMIKMLERVKKEGVLKWTFIRRAENNKTTAAIALSSVFDQGWKKWLERMESRGINLHDATYWLPSVTSPGLGKYLNKYWEEDISRLGKIAKNWNNLTPRQRTLSPKNIEIEIDAKTYVKTARIRDLALEASKWAILEKDYPNIEERFGRAIETWRSGVLEDQIPKLEYSLDGYRIFKIDREDPRGLFIGEHTLCCQHPHPDAEGRHCAWHGVESPVGGFYAVEDPDGNIIAQSWVWRNNNFMVMDNIEETIFNKASGYTRKIAEEEAKKKGLIKRKDIAPYIRTREPQIQKHLIGIVFSLYQALANHIVQNRVKDIVEVRAGWGSTSFEAPEAWAFDNEVIVPLPNDYPEKGYSDSRQMQYIIASADPNSLKTFSKLRREDA